MARTWYRPVVPMKKTKRKKKTKPKKTTKPRKKKTKSKKTKRKEKRSKPRPQTIIESLFEIHDTILDQNVSDEIKTALMEYLDANMFISFMLEHECWSRIPCERCQINFLILWDMMNHTKSMQLEPIIGTLLYLVPSYEDALLVQSYEHDEYWIRQTIFQQILSNTTLSTKDVIAIALKFLTCIEWNHDTDLESFNHFTLDILNYLKKVNGYTTSIHGSVVNGYIRMSCKQYIPNDIVMLICDFFYAYDCDILLQSENIVTEYDNKQNRLILQSLQGSLFIPMDIQMLIIQYFPFFNTNTKNSITKKVINLTNNQSENIKAKARWLLLSHI
eukprot:537959_1